MKYLHMYQSYTDMVPVSAKKHGGFTKRLPKIAMSNRYISILCIIFKLLAAAN